MTNNIMHRAIIIAGLAALLSPTELLKMMEVMDINLITKAIEADQRSAIEAKAGRDEQVDIIIELLKEIFPEAVL